MTDLLGHSNIFATLSVTNSQLYIVKYRGCPRDNIWIFLQTCKEARLLFAHTYLWPSTADDDINNNNRLNDNKYEKKD